MAEYGNLVHCTSATTGTSDFTLAAVNGKQSFNDAFGTGGTDKFYYFISNRGAAEWEVGTGHLSDAVTLVRDTVLASSNSNNAVNFSAGTKDVANDIPAAAQALRSEVLLKTTYDPTSVGGDAFDMDEMVDGSSKVAMTTTERSKLTGIEENADVTDATNVAAAGAVMDGDFSTNGLMARTGSGAYASRTITGTADQISVSNGNGQSGNPTLSLPQSIHTGATPQFTGIELGNASDTTISRVSGGVIAVEGNNVLTANLIGSTVQAYDADTLKGDVENQAITGGGTITSKSLGTTSSGTRTLDLGDCALQHYTNNGAHTLAPGSVTGAAIIDITNGASAGAITTSGWTMVSGDDFTTTNAHKFRCHCSVGNGGSLLVVQALQ